MQRLWYRRHRKPKLAYRIAVLATLSYWEFQKWSLPENVTGFRLRNDSPKISSKGVWASSLRHKLRLLACRVQKRKASFAADIFDIIKRSNTMTLDVLNIAAVVTNETGTELLPSKSCEQLLSTGLREERDRHRYTFQYWLYNWFEPGVAGVNFHDTDVLVSTSDDGNSLVIAFGGTASTADAVTNIQTFEPANHSRFFHGGRNGTVHGSLHRGFLNAYSRVERGSVLRLGPSDNPLAMDALLGSLHKRFRYCTAGAKAQAKKRHRDKKADKNNESNTRNSTEDVEASNDTELLDENDDLASDETRTSEDKPNNVKERRSGGCRTKGEKLVIILRELVTTALQSGRTVHVTGHSLGGGLASLLAMDIVVNYPHVSVSRLHLWTFGAPQVSDDVFLNSAIEVAPRLQRFVEERGNGRFHRFVTLSDDCEVDAVSEVAKRTLTSHSTTLRGRAARRLGGVHGHIVHFAEPHYLLTPDQYAETPDHVISGKGATVTRSAIAAHATINYMQGISRESKEHPLQTDLPLRLAEWLEETKAGNTTAN
jgi:hypothetical protein